MPPPAPPPPSAAKPDDDAAMTIDELAAHTGVPTRTIRFYQARGALMRPEIRGRVAYYVGAHVERLRLIAQLQDRGLRIDAIRDVVAGIDRGELDLAEWLGLEREVQAPWADDQAKTVDEDGLYALAGSRRPGLVADLLRAGLVERRDGGVYLVPSPALLGITTKLAASGIDLTIAVEAGEVLRKHLGRAVKDLVELFVKRIKHGDVAFDDPEGTFASLRPLGTEAVKVLFAREMERELRKLLESGAVKALRGRKKRR
ncbi:MAG: MerR family transcriptional regulator [Deltaproteobacteria bacterium]|nr:MerR family transcriptional regulator [Kofleriaceae bacterium]